MPTGSVGVPATLMDPLVALLQPIALLPPIAKGSIFNTVVLAATDFFAPVLSPTNTPTLFAVYVCLSVGGIFSVRRTRGAVTVTEELNGPLGALTAGKAYAFDVFVSAGDTINFRTSVGATIVYCAVVEKDLMV